MQSDVGGNKKAHVVITVRHSGDADGRVPSLRECGRAMLAPTGDGRQVARATVGGRAMLAPTGEEEGRQVAGATEGNGGRPVATPTTGDGGQAIFELVNDGFAGRYHTIQKPLFFLGFSRVYPQITIAVTITVTIAISISRLV